MNTSSLCCSATVARTLVVAGVFVAAATAQCGLIGQGLTHTPDADGDVLASATWDPDGAGPAPAVIVFGGSFRLLGSTMARGLALYDPTSREFSTLGTGVANDSTVEPMVTAVTALPNGDLVVGGWFTSIDGVAANRVARWDGTSWQPMGTWPAFGAPAALHGLPNGDVVAGTGLQSVLRWDGSTWSSMGTNPNGTVRCFATLPNGDLLVGGLQVLGNANLARFDGTSWSAFGGGGVDGNAFAIQPLPNGDLVVAGFFNTAGGIDAPGIARWNGSTWSSLGTGLLGNAFAYALTRLPNGDLVAGGVFTLADGAPANQVARWNGTSWSAMGAGLGTPWPEIEPVLTLQPLANGEVIAGGKFLSADGTKDRVARWNGSAWTSLRTGSGRTFFDAIQATNGDLVVAGDFLHLEGTTVRRIARRVGGVWQPLGTGIDDGAVHVVLELPNGDLVVGGTFTSAGGAPANRVARWDGSTWHALGGGLTGTVQDLAYHAATGQVLASGTFADRFVVWDGVAWHGTGLAPTTQNVIRRRFETTPAGDVLAYLGNFVARWTGVFWEPITLPVGPAVPFLTGPDGFLVRLPNGDLIAGSGSLRRWDGAAWSALPSAPIAPSALLALPDGSVLVTARQSQLVPGPHLARWDGSTWQVVGAPAFGTIERLRWADGERLLAAGDFPFLLGVPTAGLGEIVSTCPAGATSVGTGCTGSGGPNVLTAQSLTWIGSTYRSVATGMPTSGVVLEVYGLGGLSLPLASVLPQAGPGCDALATPDLLRLHLPQNGAALLELAIPNTPSFVGSVWHQQVVPFEIDALGAIVDVTASNALVHTLGAF